MALVESIIGFVVSLLIGAAGIYLGASLLTDVEDYTYAIVTALIASLGLVPRRGVPRLDPLLRGTAGATRVYRRDQLPLPRRLGRSHRHRPDRLVATIVILYASPCWASRPGHRRSQRLIDPPRSEVGPLPKDGEFRSRPPFRWSARCGGCAAVRPGGRIGSRL